MYKPDWGVLFDWDGVIIDSSAFHERSWELVAEREGLVLPPDHFHRGFGKRNEEIIPEMLQWASDPAEVRRLADAKEEAYRELIRADGIRPLPGVAVWLDRLDAAGVPFAVGSSTPRENIDCVLALWGWEGRFAAVVASADVLRGKPDPEVFLKAAAAIGVLPSCAVVFEDSPMGVEAGLGAGARVVAVAGTHPAGTFPHAHRVVRRMDELQVAELAAWFPARMRQASDLISGPGFRNAAAVVQHPGGPAASHAAAGGQGRQADRPGRAGAGLSR
jgi:HAD superfamily hydrolase (TIGR01509 family)